jgi:hypothetical protein
MALNKSGMRIGTYPVVTAFDDACAAIIPLWETCRWLLATLVEVIAEAAKAIAAALGISFTRLVLSEACALIACLGAYQGCKVGRHQCNME